MRARIRATLLYSILVVIGLVTSDQTTPLFGQEGSIPTDWVDVDQSIVIVCRDVTLTLDHLENLPFLQHAGMVEMWESLQDTHTRELFRDFNEAMDLERIAEDWQRFRGLRIQRMYFTLDGAAPWDEGWMLAFDIREGDKGFLDALLTNSSDEFARSKKPEDGQLLRIETGHGPSPVRWFTYNNWAVIAANEAKASAVLKALRDETLPERSFSENRKWLGTVFLASDYPKSDVLFFVDPTRLSQQFPGLAPSTWMELGLRDIISASGVVSLASSVADTETVAIAQATCLLKISAPRQGIWKMFDGTRHLPKLPPFPPNTIQGLVISVDPEPTWQYASTFMGNLGPALLRKMETECTGAFGVSMEQLSQALSGLYCQLQVGGNEELPGYPCLVVGIEDREAFQAMFASYVAKSLPGARAKQDPSSVGQTAWFLSQEEFEAKMVSGSEKLRPEQVAYVIHPNRNLGYVLADDLAISSNQAAVTEMLQGSLLEFDNCHASLHAPLTELRSLGNAPHPFASAFMRDEFLRRQVTGIQWSFERRRRTKADGSWDMRGVEPSLVPLSECESVREWFDQALIRLLNSISEELDLGAVEAYDEEVGIRISAGLYAEQE